jgi:MFS superfamily sulfate permease-like transporter
MYIPKEHEKHRRIIIELGPLTLLGLLQIPLICLKLVNLIQFPWWMVLLPSGGMIALSVILAIIAGIVWWIKNTFYFSKR